MWVNMLKLVVAGAAGKHVMGSSCCLSFPLLTSSSAPCSLCSLDAPWACFLLYIDDLDGLDLEEHTFVKSSRQLPFGLNNDFQRGKSDQPRGACTHCCGGSSAASKSLLARDHGSRRQHCRFRALQKRKIA